MSEGTRLVGRVVEMATLQGLIGEVAGGSSALLRISGQSGLGKSRLAREAVRLARTTRFATMVSRPTAYGEGTAFGAAIVALGPLLRSRTATERVRLVGDLPQLGLLFAGVEMEPATPMADAALQRLVLIEGLSRLTERIAGEGPLLWVIDGLERVDRASVELFQRLAVALADRPVLLLVTGQDGGGGASVALERACADCGWQRARIALRPLADADAIALAEDVLGSTASEPLRQVIRDRCAGTPLWIVATAQALLDGGHLVVRDGALDLTGTTIPLPAHLDEQLQASIGELDESERAVLRALAVAGGPLPLDVLDSWAPGAGTAADAATNLERHRLVAWTETGCDVAHGMLREVVLAHLTDTERRSTHADLARALRNRDPDDPRVAEHALGAGPLAGADLVPGELIRGARKARSIGATTDAYRFLRVALMAYPRNASDADSNSVPAEMALQAEAGEVAGQLGDHAAAREHWRRSLAGYSAAGLAVGTARAHRGLAGVDWSRGQLGEAQEHLEAAERALAGLEPGPELGEIYYARTVHAQRLADADAVRREATRLAQLARRTSSPHLAARAQLAAAASAYARTDYGEATRLNDEALAAAAEAGEPTLLVRANDQASVAAAAVGDLPSLRTHSRTSVDVAAASGLRLLGWWPRARLAFADLMRGDLDSALRTSADVVTAAEREAPPRGRVSSFAGHALLLTHQGHLDEAREFLRRCQEAPKEVLAADRNVVTIVEYASVVLALAEGEPGAAHEVGARLEELAGGWVPLLAAALLAEAYADADRPDEAIRVAARIGAVRSCPTSLPHTLVQWINGLAGAATERPENLAVAVAGFEELGLLLHANRARLRLSAADGVAAQTAIETARHAHGFFESMGSPAPTRRAQELLRGFGVTLPRARPRRDTGTPLSPRELEVARLVADGLSNAAVATELFISPRTVTTHLDHIYVKLDLSSRVALTRYLADSDLLEANPAAQRTSIAPRTTNT